MATGITYTEQRTGCRALYAISKESGKLVNIKNVRRGKDCDCLCLGCGEELVANKGEIKAHYFSHLPDSSGKSNRPCKKPQNISETLSHERGKIWLEQTRTITLPAYYLHKETDKDGCKYTSIKVLESKNVIFTKVILEAWQSENKYRPDCIGYIGDQPIIIEIYVSHKVDPIKLEKIKSDKLPAIEIILKNGVSDDSWDSIDKIMKSSSSIR